MKIRKSTALLFIICFAAVLLSGCGIKVVKKNTVSAQGKYTGKTVILHTNDVHGAVTGYSCLPELKRSIESEGGTVIIADAGDFTSGSVYVNDSKGESAVALMNMAGYDVAIPGNHEFDYGTENLEKNLSKAEFSVLASNILKDGKRLYDPSVIFKSGGLKIGFLGIVTPETMIKALPSKLGPLKFLMDSELFDMASKEAAKLKRKCDLVICLAHLGVDESSAGSRSVDLYENVPGIDFIIDGHSHTVMSGSPEGYPVQQTGTKFENIGMIVIDNKTRCIESYELLPAEGLPQDTDVLAAAENVIATVEEQYGRKIAECNAVLDGEKDHVRTGETGLGDLICDAMLWSAVNETVFETDDDNIVAIINSGAIRASIGAGDITRKDVNNTLPFSNTLSVCYVEGKELLEALEASAFAAPEPVGGFPQISGMKITIDVSEEYDKGDLYPGSTYYRPRTIKRVHIDEINGKPFDENAKYAVVTNNFVTEGGDTYYAFKRSYMENAGFDTGIPLDDTLANYINYELNGKVGDEYASPAGRITVKGLD